jgi:hypothetical protein
VTGRLDEVMASRSEKKGVVDLRRRLLASLEREVVASGAATGLDLDRYERAATIVAVDPDPADGEAASRAHPPPGVPSRSWPRLPRRCRSRSRASDAAVSTFVLFRCGLPPRRSPRFDGSYARAARSSCWSTSAAPDGRALAGPADAAPPKPMGNCHLSRDTLVSVRAAGFDPTGVVRAELPRQPALYRAAILGRATRISS